MRISSTPSPSEVPHALRLTPQSKAGSAASLSVGGPPVGDTSGAHTLKPAGDDGGGAQAYYTTQARGGARTYYASTPGKVDVLA